MSTKTFVLALIATAFAASVLAGPAAADGISMGVGVSVGDASAPSASVDVTVQTPAGDAGVAVGENVAPATVADQPATAAPTVTVLPSTPVTATHAVAPDAGPNLPQASPAPRGPARQVRPAARTPEPSVHLAPVATHTAVVRTPPPTVRRAVQPAARRRGVAPDAPAHRFHTASPHPATAVPAGPLPKLWSALAAGAGAAPGTGGGGGVVAVLGGLLWLTWLGAARLLLVGPRTRGPSWRPHALERPG